MRKVETYERFEGHLAAWSDGDVPRLAVLGPTGVGKSQGYSTALGNRRYHLFSGRLTPLELYLRLYDAPDLPVVLDDISALLRHNDFRDMLKGLCETGTRTIRWGTTTPLLKGRNTSTQCNSPVLIVLNKVPKNDPDVEAVLDRCDVIRFEPAKAEIIARMRFLFPEDWELIDLIEELPALPSLRTLIKAQQWKKSKHLNLVEELLSECGVSGPIAGLVRIMESCPEEEWCARYVEETKLTDRTYRRHKYFAEQIVGCRRPPDECPIVQLQ